MNRDIKFRGKSLVDGKWYYGSLIVRENHQTKSELCVIKYYAGDDIYGRGFKYYADMIVDPKTVGQYIGLIDKNDKEIYEGDIIQITNPLGCMPTTMRIEWDKETCSFDSKLPDGRTPSLKYDLTTNNIEEFKIIGNIFENSELLEAKKCTTKTV